VKTTKIKRKLKRTAIQDLLKKSITSGYWTEEQFNQWLSNAKRVQSEATTEHNQLVTNVH
jgi:hypothetical protein